MLLRVPRVRFSHSTFAAFHRSIDSIECGTCDPAVASRAARSSLRAGWDGSSARTFGYSVSPEDGGRLSATLELTRSLLGADGNGVAATIDARRYVVAWPRHGIVAVRAAGAASWGDRAAARIFTASGHGPPPAGFAFGSDAIGLLRGFAEDEVTGTRAAVLNVDYRFPLVRLDRGAGTVPVFLRAVHGAVFADGGTAWSGPGRRARMRTAAGVELSVDAVLGFALPVTFSTGAAWRHGPAEDERGIVAFTRIGRAF
jgi:hypothetical protein